MLLTVNLRAALQAGRQVKGRSAPAGLVCVPGEDQEILEDEMCLITLSIIIKQVENTD